MNATVPDLVWCVYPISGIYTQFQRILYWIVIILILFFQVSPWLTAGALAYAVTYSINAGIHAMLLGTQATSVYDADLFALQIVTQTTCHASVLCLLFSPRLFDTIVTPCFLLGSLVLYCTRWIMQTKGSRTMFSIEDHAVLTNCTSRDLCENPCAGMEAVTLFRGASDSLQPVILLAHLAPVNSNVTVIDDWIAKAPVVSWDSCVWLNGLWVWYLALGRVLQCAITSSSKAPREVRNLIFCRLRKRYVPKGRVQSRKRLIYIASLKWTRYAWILFASLAPELRILGTFAKYVLWIVEAASGYRIARFQELVVWETSKNRTSYILAKILATMWFFVGESSYTLSVGGIMYLTFKTEMSMKWIPESETKNNVGQWSTWTAVGLALFAAIIHRIVAEPTDEKKKIILHDSDMDAGEAHENALMTKMMKNVYGQLVQYVLAEFKHKWLEFRYWWHHTIEASELDATEDEKRKRRHAQVQDEAQVWDKFAPLFAQGQDVVNPSHPLDRRGLRRSIVV